ncbi:MAG TPA: conjugal transfer protein TraL [Terriglobia bacterium]|nr:conjugal transfer protein TraL [Terriglobia bacterium]
MAEQSNVRPTTAIHLSLQGKGGVGKSLIASLLAQYFKSKSDAVQCIDTDPVNHTLAQYKQLNVQKIKLLRDGGIDQRGFDVLMETLLKGSGVFVVDSGASTFIPLWHYILEHNVIAVLNEAGRRLYIHNVITGGQAQEETLRGFRQLADTTTSRNLVVWVNEYFGRVESEGKGFLEMLVTKQSAGKVLGSVVIPRRTADTFGRDIEEMITRKQTFDEAIESSESFIMTKQRLKIVQRELFEQLDKLPLAA